MVNEIGLKSLDDDARTGSMTYTVPNPRDGQVVTCCLAAPFEFEILRVLRKTTDGDCDITFRNHGTVIDLDDGDTSGSIIAQEGAFQESLPGTDPNNHTVATDHQLDFVIDNTSTLSIGLIVQIDYRYTEPA